MMLHKIRFILLLPVTVLLVSFPIAQSGIDPSGIGGATPPNVEQDDPETTFELIDDPELVQEALEEAAGTVTDQTTSGLGNLANILSQILLLPEGDELDNEALLQAFADLIGDEDLDIEDEGARDAATEIAKVQLGNLRRTLETVNITPGTDLRALPQEQVREVVNATQTFIETVQTTLTQSSIADDDPEAFEKRAAINAFQQVISSASISNRFNIGTAANPLTIGGFAKPLAQAPTYVYDATSLVGGAAGLISYVFTNDNFSIFSEGIFPIGSPTVTYSAADTGALTVLPLRTETVIFTDYAVINAAGGTVDVSGNEPYFHVIELSDVLPANRILIERYDPILNDYVVLPMLGDRVTNTVLYSTYAVDALNYSFLPLIAGVPEGGVVTGTTASEVLRGEDANDILRGGAGNDILRGLGGNDEVRGEAGNDFLRGGSGDDVLIGGPGNDILVLGQGNDRYEAGGGTDTLYGPDLRVLMTLGEGGECEAIDITEAPDGSGGISGVCANGLTHTFRVSSEAPFVPFGQ